MEITDKGGEEGHDKSETLQKLQFVVQQFSMEALHMTMPQQHQPGS